MDLSKVAKDLVDRDRLHRKLLLLFPDYPGGAPNARERMGIIFRAEPPVIYLQSSIEPISTRIPDGYKIVITKEITTHYASLKTGSVYRFRLEANVCYRESASRSRKALETGEEMEEWLFRHGEQGGFKVVDYVAETLPQIRARKGSFHVVRFDGVLKVETLEPFLKTLREGVGPAKVYGCGMISLGK
jgi:CRISPR system Cascade subunit CasE